MHNIKKYANRKLYDITEKRYVTMDDIVGFIKSGEEIKIIDNTTNKDITREVVSQLVGRVFDSQARKLPLSTLFQLLRKSGGGIVGFSKRYLSFWKSALSYATDELDKVETFIRSDQEVDEKYEEIEPDNVSSENEEMEILLNNRIDQRLETILHIKNFVAMEQFSKLKQSITILETKMATTEKMFIQLLKQDKNNTLK